MPLKEPPCEQGGRRRYESSGDINNSSVTSHCGGGVLREYTVYVAQDPSVSFFLLTRQHLAGCSRLFPKRTCLALKAAPSGLGRLGGNASLPPPLPAGEI